MITPRRARRSARPRTRRRAEQPAALLRVLEQVYANAREDPLRAALRQRLER